MLIDKNIERYLIPSDECVQAGLQRLSETKLRILFLVDGAGRLEASFTDGDLRRWLLTNRGIDLQTRLSEISNRNVVACPDDAGNELIADHLSDRIRHVPLIDNRGRVVAVASLSNPVISIGEHSINTDSPTLIVAEIGNNHNGDVARARTLVDEAIAAGADCVKFQMRDMDSLYANRGDSNDMSEDLGSQYVLDLLSRFQLGDGDLSELFEYCRACGTTPLCTPFDIVSADKLDEQSIAAFKIASADLPNHDLIRHLASKGRPLLLSTGMSSEEEIISTVALLDALGAQFILLHCNSTYPAPFEDINLRYMARLREIGRCFIGYSGHERGYHVPVAAVAMGAKVIEKHFTLDRSMEGNDHKVSLLPAEFKQMVRSIRELEKAMGFPSTRRISQGERLNRETLGKSLVMNSDVPRGGVIEEAMLDVRSPGKGLPPYRKSDLVGKHAVRDLKPGDFLFDSDVRGETVAPREYTFPHRFGIPVRYHDVNALAPLTNLKLVEFHLSYKDMNVDPTAFFPVPMDLQFAVHAPELFSGDHTLDLCSPDPRYRERSISELQRVVDVAIALKPCFPETVRPYIVVNVGGFTEDGFLSAEDSLARYELLGESLSRIVADGVEILPQTMPPFPWHFGGQRYHNLFVSAGDIVEFCERHCARVCLDIAHSRLACNFYEWNFEDFVAAVAPYAAHIHVSDCRGTNDEGLQIGDGEIDFEILMRQLEKLAPEASWIPEIWQGHKNNAEGFWLALDRLERFASRPERRGP